jgi:UDP-2,4-diacetamido-2,4,6-trideoxy-beta-L-altropyranose hydrolase
MMKNLVFRVDSSLNIGSGHVMRCITLANNLMKIIELECTFITRENDGNFNDIITHNGFQVILLDGSELNENVDNYSAWLGNSQENDATQTLAVLKKYGLENIDILVVDHYALDIEWERQFRCISNKLVVIDDLANRMHCCDILLDQNLAPDYARRYDNLTPVDCKKFLGIAYCLLRDDFLIAKTTVKARERLSNILIFFGGVDKDNATLKLLCVLTKELNLFESVRVIVGQSNPFKRQIKDFCIEYENCHYLEQVTNMAEIISQSDLAIGAGGATTGERIFLGLPSFVFSLADNQVEVSKYLHENNYITFLGDQGEIGTSDIISELVKYIDSPELLKRQSMNLLEVGESKINHLVQEIAYD